MAPDLSIRCHNYRPSEVNKAIYPVGFMVKYAKGVPLKLGKARCAFSSCAMNARETALPVVVRQGRSPLLLAHFWIIGSLAHGDPLVGL